MTEATRETLQQHVNRRIHTETIDGVDYHIRSLTLDEWLDYCDSENRTTPDLLLLTLSNSSGELLLDKNSEEDRQLVHGLDSRIGDGLTKAAWSHCAYDVVPDEDEVKN